MPVLAIWPNGAPMVEKTAFDDRWTPETVALWHEWVRERSGLSFYPHRISKLLEGIEDRMAVIGLLNLNNYWQRLNHDPSELAALISLLTVNETYFSRGIEELNLFADLLVPEFLSTQAKQGTDVRPLSIVSAGCSSGEEVYSIAMTLLESHGDSVPFTVYGGDVDSQALTIARSGLYGENAFRSLDTGLRDRYFSKTQGDKEKIAAIVRDRVHFFALNLVSDRYPFQMHGADFIFYRNVSIYFNQATKKRIFSRLIQGMTPGGCLFVSPAEIFFHNQAEIKPNAVHLESRHGRFFFRKQPLHNTSAPLTTHRPAVHHPAITKRPSSEETACAAPQTTPASITKERLAKALRLLQERRHKKALAQLDLLLQEQPEHTQATLLKAATLLHGDTGLVAIRMAQQLCQAVLAKDALHFEALLVLAMGMHQQGVQPLVRIAHLKAAIFLRPSCWLPHFYLAQAYEVVNQLTMAAQEYRVVIYQITKEGRWPDHGLPFFPLSFSEDELISICQFKLQQIHPS